MLKKFLTTALSIAMIFTTIQSASAQIEVWEFDDGTRVARFTNNDFDGMIALYEQYVAEKKAKLFTGYQNIVIKAIGISIGLAAFVGGIAITNKQPETKSSELGGTAMFLIGLLSITASFYPEYVKSKVGKELTGGDVKMYDWLGVQDVLKILIEEKKHIYQIRRDGVERAISEDEMSEVGRLFYRANGYKIGLLTKEAIQKYCYYILIERPKLEYEKAKYPSCLHPGYRSWSIDTNDLKLDFRLSEVFRALSDEKLNLKKSYTFSVSEGMKEIEL